MAAGKGALDFDQLVEAYPELRQSALSSFDDCALSAMFEMKYAQGWSSHPQARGTIFHAWAAMALKEMQEEGDGRLPVDVGMQLLQEAIMQRHVPPEERLNLPMNQIRELRIAVVKFCKDNTWDIKSLFDVERRIYAKIVYPDDNGEARNRMLTGQADAIFTDRRDESHLIVMDWKHTWGLPPEQEEGSRGEKEGRGLSYLGYFQQRFYGFLLLSAFKHINKITLREYYPLYSKARQSSLTREDLPVVEAELAALVYRYDDALRHGLVKTNKRWTPSPGKHCSYCTRPDLCTIDQEAKGEGMIRNEAHAKKVAGRMIVFQTNYNRDKAGLRAWNEVHGSTPVKSAKGRREVGFKVGKRTDRPTKEQVQAAEEQGIDPSSLYVTKVVTSHTTYTPEGSDRAASPADENLKNLMDASLAEAQASKRGKGKKKK